jgi:hypothetical protein
MEITEIKAIPQDVIKDIICDCCGVTCNSFSKALTKQFEFLKIEGSWGYGSKKDGEKWSAQICEKCVDEKFAFVNFKKENYNILGD